MSLPNPVIVSLEEVSSSIKNIFGLDRIPSGISTKDVNALVYMKFEVLGDRKSVV